MSRPEGAGVTVWDFITPLIIILPGAYLVWFVFATFFVVPAAALTALLADWLFSEPAVTVSQHGVFLLIRAQTVSQLPVFDQFQVYAPPLGAGLPLFLALALASDAAVREHAWRIPLGVLCVVLGQTVSILLKIAAELFSSWPPTPPADAFCSVDCYWMMLYYVQYFTYMVLPGLLPLLVWASLYPAYVRALIGRLLSRADSTARQG